MIVDVLNVPNGRNISIARIFKILAKNILTKLEHFRSNGIFCIFEIVSQNKPIMKKAILIIVILLLFASCGKSKQV